jgi:hypothetical protein
VGGAGPSRACAAARPPGACTAEREDIPDDHGRRLRARAPDRCRRVRDGVASCPPGPGAAGRRAQAAPVGQRFARHGAHAARGHRPDRARPPSRGARARGGPRRRRRGPGRAVRPGRVARRPPGRAGPADPGRRGGGGGPHRGGAGVGPPPGRDARRRQARQRALHLRRRAAAHRLRRRPHPGRGHQRPGRRHGRVPGARAARRRPPRCACRRVLARGRLLRGARRAGAPHGAWAPRRGACGRRGAASTARRGGRRPTGAGRGGRDGDGPPTRATARHRRRVRPGAAHGGPTG